MTPNRRAVPLLILAGVLVLAALLALAIGSQRRIVAEARSPEGSWAVAVVGQQILFGIGRIEITFEVRDGNGKPVAGSQVIGSCASWSDARAKFGSASCGPTQAVINGRTVRRKDYLGF